MQKIIFYFFGLFVLFYACTTNQSEPQNTNAPGAVNKSNADEVPVATPIPPPNLAGKSYKKVKQASSKDLVYPKRYEELGVPKFSNAKIENNIMLDNDFGKYGQRIKLACSGDYDQILDFYAEKLVENGWVKNDEMDKTLEDEDIRFFSTNYMKNGAEYTLMFSATDIGNNKVSISQIVKEN